MMLERLGFSDTAAAYLTRDCGIDSLEDTSRLDGDDDAENTIKGVASPGGTVTVGIWTSAVTSLTNRIPVSIRAVENLKLCVYYLKHIERVQRKPVVTDIDLEVVRSYRDQQIYEGNFNKTAKEPVINDKDWHHTLENIKEYLASQYGETGAILDYVVRPEITVKPEAEDLVEDYDKVYQEINAHAPHSGWDFVNDMRKVYDIMSNICGNHSCFVYIKPALRTRNGRDAYMLMFDHFPGANNGGNMASASGTKLTGTLYNGEKKRYMEPHYVLNGLKYYGSIYWKASRPPSWMSVRRKSRQAQLCGMT
jgi:hypothetical protein